MSLAKTQRESEGENDSTGEQNNLDHFVDCEIVVHSFHASEFSFLKLLRRGVHLRAQRLHLIVGSEIYTSSDNELNNANRDERRDHRLVFGIILPQKKETMNDAMPMTMKKRLSCFSAEK